MGEYFVRTQVVLLSLESRKPQPQFPTQCVLPSLPVCAEQRGDVCAHHRGSPWDPAFLPFSGISIST